MFIIDGNEFLCVTIETVFIQYVINMGLESIIHFDRWSSTVVRHDKPAMRKSDHSEIFSFFELRSCI